MNKYPIYIVSKGRYKMPYTANWFKEDGISFKIVVEPQEYEQYCESIGENYVLKLPFSNLGLGSYPARNFCWDHSKENGHERHWIFDDNIRRMRRLHKGKRQACNGLIGIKTHEDFIDRYTNIAISGFDYTFFVVNDTDKPFRYNTHVYSSLLIDNSLPFRWRLKYNEDVDLCLQVLHAGYCTVCFTAFIVDKISTTVKLAGGNQDELYKGNDPKKKYLKARSLEEVWPQYVKTTYKFNRPHHSVSWKKHFKQPLIRKKDIDWNEIKSKKYDIKLK
jgi:hypothetical protein